MTSKKARLRKPQGGSGITLTKNSLSRAQRKVATAKKLAAAAPVVIQRTTLAPPSTAAEPVAVKPSRPTAPPAGTTEKRIRIPLPKKDVKK